MAVPTVCDAVVEQHRRSYTLADLMGGGVPATSALHEGSAFGHQLRKPAVCPLSEGSRTRRGAAFSRSERAVPDPLSRHLGGMHVSAASQKQNSPAPWSARIRPSPTTSAIEGIASDVDLLCDFDGIVDFDAEVAHGALNLGMPKQELYGAQVTGCGDRSAPPSCAVVSGCRTWPDRAQYWQPTRARDARTVVS